MSSTVEPGPPAPEPVPEPATAPGNARAASESSLSSSSASSSAAAAAQAQAQAAQAQAAAAQAAAAAAQGGGYKVVAAGQHPCGFHRGVLFAPTAITGTSDSGQSPGLGAAPDGWAVAVPTFESSSGLALFWSVRGQRWVMGFADQQCEEEGEAGEHLLAGRATLAAPDFHGPRRWSRRCGPSATTLEITIEAFEGKADARARARRTDDGVAKPDVAGIAKHAAELQQSSGGLEEQCAALHYFRCLLSGDIAEPPIARVLASGVLPCLLECVSAEAMPSALRMEALWVVSNLASGSSEQTAQLAEAGAVPLVVPSDTVDPRRINTD
jgi:hypothetical protein